MDSCVSAERKENFFLCFDTVYSGKHRPLHLMCISLSEAMITYWRQNQFHSLSAREQCYKTDFAITQLMARFRCIISACTCNFAISIWSSPNATYIEAAFKYFWTQLASQIIHQNLAVILQEFNYGKNSFIQYKFAKVGTKVCQIWNLKPYQKLPKAF